MREQVQLRDNFMNVSTNYCNYSPEEDEGEVEPEQRPSEIIIILCEKNLLFLMFQLRWPAAFHAELKNAKIESKLIASRHPFEKKN